METQEQKAPATPADEAAKGVQNTLGVIRVVEGLFNAMGKGTYPLHVHDAIVAGMQFLSQFHSQLIGQLPPALVEELRKASVAQEGTPVAAAQAKPEEATSGQHA